MKHVIDLLCHLQHLFVEMSVCVWIVGGKQWPLGTVAIVTTAGQCNVTVAAVTSAGYRTAGVSGIDLTHTPNVKHYSCFGMCSVP